MERPGGAGWGMLGSMEPKPDNAGGEPSPVVNLARRVKRGLWARDQDFFAVTAPGLEEICALEFAALGIPGAEAQTGGVAFRGRLEQAYAANLWLRTAVRVLMRLKDFRVRTWADYERQAAAVPWEFYLGPGAALEALVTLHESNLKHSGRVGEVILQAASTRLRELGLEPPHAAGPEEPACRVMVRGVGRRAMVSLDMSGPHLHMRGYRRAAGTAPLREDLAAALLLMCEYNGVETLLDPMCGAGTLAIEAALMARRMAPGAKRSFALEDWPAFRRPAWEHLVKQAAAGARPTAPGPILAADRSANAVKAAGANAARAGVAGDITLDQADFFTAAPPPGPPGLVVINPPYGRRLLDPARAARFQRDLAGHMARAYAGWRVGLVLAQVEWADLWNLSDAQGLTVPHGGMHVTLVTGRIPA